MDTTDFLDRVRNALREDPELAKAAIVHLVRTELEEQAATTVGRTSALLRRGAHTTSAAAAAAIAPHAGNLRGEVLAALAVHDDDGGLADQQLQQMLGMGTNTERPRRRELVTAGLVVDSGKVTVINGREHALWRTTTTGYDLGMSIAETLWGEEE